jgi:hypothetical protein
MFRLQVTVIRQTFQYMDMSAWWWLLVTETCSKLYIIEYIVVFWLNEILVSATTQRDYPYKKNLYEFSLQSDSSHWAVSTARHTDFNTAGLPIGLKSLVKRNL